MKMLTVYIVTDANRKFLDVGMTNNLGQTMFELESQNKVLFSSFSHLNRIVYFQNVENEYEANKLSATLKSYTRMQIEKLVRKSNPNWLNLCAKPILKKTKKVVAYA